MNSTDLRNPQGLYVVSVQSATITINHSLLQVQRRARYFYVHQQRRSQPFPSKAHYPSLNPRSSHLQTVWTYNQVRYTPVRRLTTTQLKHCTPLQMVIAAGLASLYDATDDESYLTVAQVSIDAAIRSLENHGILKESCDSTRGDTTCTSDEVSSRIPP